MSPTRAAMTMYPREQLIGRLDSVQGHLAGVRRMLLGGAAYPEVLLQVRAVRGALRHIEGFLVQEGLYSCLEQARDGQPDEALQEMLSLFSLQEGVKEPVRPGATPRR